MGGGLLARSKHVTECPNSQDVAIVITIDIAQGVGSRWEFDEKWRGGLIRGQKKLSDTWKLLAGFLAYQQINIHQSRLNNNWECDQAYGE